MKYTRKFVAEHLAAQLYLQGFDLDLVAGGLDKESILRIAEILKLDKERIHKETTRRGGKITSNVLYWLRRG